jgi:Rrf2 family nitric oxide-sensitive transcriptional repressor
MRLTKHTEYALRVLLFVGSSEAEYVFTEDISQSYQISNHHLVKIVNQLGKEGILLVRRGRQGGIRLGKPATDINIGALVRQTEPDFQLAECFAHGESGCPIHSVCSLIDPLEKARDAFLAALDEYTLADLLEPPKLHQIRLIFQKPHSQAQGAAAQESAQ